MKSIEETEETRCGFVAIVGRPNVGKSSLLNAILGKKVSITTYKPQTTRHQILGIKTLDNVQTVYVDTPGIHLGAKKALNRQMNKVAQQSLIDVNGVVFVVEALKWTPEDNLVCQMLKNETCPIIVALNKVDLVPNKQELLFFIQKLNDYLPQAQIVPISAKKGIQLDIIEQSVTNLLPLSSFYFPREQTVNHSERFYIAEIVREKLMCLLDKELPYAVTVEIETLEHQAKIVHINALIWVEREGQKGIIVGEKGTKLRDVGTRARHDLERYYGKKVCLKLWAKVKESWSDDVRALQSLGYVES